MGTARMYVHSNRNVPFYVFIRIFFTRETRRAFPHFFIFCTIHCFKRLFYQRDRKIDRCIFRIINFGFNNLSYCELRSFHSLFLHEINLILQYTPVDFIILLVYFYYFNELSYFLIVIGLFHIIDRFVLEKF